MNDISINLGTNENLGNVHTVRQGRWRLSVASSWCPRVKTWKPGMHGGMPVMPALRTGDKGFPTQAGWPDQPELESLGFSKNPTLIQKESNPLGYSVSIYRHTHMHACTGFHAVCCMHAHTYRLHTHTSHTNHNHKLKNFKDDKMHVMQKATLLYSHLAL